jgi:putative toxin-antitoxin system antitoxin component (TIGR02293 family)
MEYTTSAKQLGLGTVSLLELHELIILGFPRVVRQNLLNMGFYEEDLLVLKHDNLDRPYSPEQSELCLRMAAVYWNAVSLFGDRDTALEWMGTPKEELGNNSPLSLLVTEEALMRPMRR